MSDEAKKEEEAKAPEETKTVELAGKDQEQVAGGAMPAGGTSSTIKWEYTPGFPKLLDKELKTLTGGFDVIKGNTGI